jgi:hypothetical protein
MVRVDSCARKNENSLANKTGQPWSGNPHNQRPCPTFAPRESIQRLEEKRNASEMGASWTSGTCNFRAILLSASIAFVVWLVDIVNWADITRNDRRCNVCHRHTAPNRLA